MGWKFGSGDASGDPLVEDKTVSWGSLFKKKKKKEEKK